MKKYFMVLAILTIISSTILGEGSMQKNEAIITNSKTEEVTLFLTGAQIKKNSSVNLKQGENTLTFTKLPSNLKPESIQVEVEDNYKIISIDHKINYFDTPTNPERIETLQNELKKTKEELELVKVESDILSSELEVLTANKEFNKNSNLKLDEFKAFNDFFKKSIEEISYKGLEVSKKRKDLEKKYTALQNELKNNKNIRQSVSEIRVQIFSDKEAVSEIELNYYVSDSGWEPFYDIRIETDSDKAIMNLKANIFQNTGEDWNDVLLILSTSNPNLGMNEPRLHPWRLEFYTEAPTVRANESSKKNNQPSFELSMSEEMVDIEMDMEYSDTPLSIASDNQTALEFILSEKISIPTSLSKSIDVANYELSTKLKHYSVRKLDMDVFLLASLTGWENMNLLSGNANIFLSGAFVGKGYINPATIKDNLEVSLGRDKQVIVNRIKNTDFKSKATFGSNIKETRSFDITIRNLKTKPINIEVIDQVPLSTDSSIVVNVDKNDISSAVFDETTGELKWILTMEGGSTETKKFKYTVTYPNKNIVILE